MPLFFRFFLPLVFALGGLAYVMTPIAYQLTQQWFIHDLDIRSRLIWNAIKDRIEFSPHEKYSQNEKKVLELLRKTAQDERLLAVGICSANDTVLLKTELFPNSFRCSQLNELEPLSGVIQTAKNGEIHISYGFIYLHEKAKDSGQPNQGYPEPSQLGLGKIIAQSNFASPAKLVFVHDMSFAMRRGVSAQKLIFLLFLTIGLVTASITIIVAYWSRALWIRSVRTLFEGVRDYGLDFRTTDREFSPILKDLRVLLREVEKNSLGNDDPTINWSANTLKAILLTKLSGKEIIVASNRQPYIHQRSGDSIKIQFPASGLVSALEPILRACSGVWVAHGNGSADKDVVDHRDRVAVPPESPKYDIHRIWISEEEERGYYYGFANEGIWPLCHIAHIRPIFRHSDWDHYVKVNRRFAEAIIQDTTTEAPVVLVQDYHLALVPRFVREFLPEATIITFWHIPWPNPESFGICPWRIEILKGLLGSSIVGFHTKFHCNNFLDCIDRMLEARIDRETNSISFLGKATDVRSYPISIEWPPAHLAGAPSAKDCRAAVIEEYSLDPSVKIGIGVDRLDYTKGIVERFLSVERLLESEPGWVGKFVFVQIAAPTRSSIPTYQLFDNEVRGVAERINNRFGHTGYKPILLKVEHHAPIDVFKHLRAADVCVVTSLADGMNLVAKEFVASRDDEYGVLILSMFAGASRELFEALIVNPYDIEMTYRALLKALTMTKNEQQIRMHAMRAIVRDYNVYRWASRMLIDAARVRQRGQIENLETKGSREMGINQSEALMLAAMANFSGFIPGRTLNK